MNDADLRALVRDAVARHLSGQVNSSAPAAVAAPRPAGSDRGWAQHSSHVQFLQLINVGDACLIEPSVECTHCGYCKSQGH
jgi:hypothetical protein